METPVDPSHYASLLVERADQREAERRLRRERLLEEAAALGERLRHTYGQHLRVFLIGSVTDLDFFRRDSDIDIAAMGLRPEQYCCL